MRYLLRRIVVLAVSRCSSNRLTLVGKQEAAFVRACSPGERRSERMLHEKRRLAFTICSGLILAVIVGCASHTNPDVNASRPPSPKSSARTDIAADACGTIAQHRWRRDGKLALSPYDPGLGVDRSADRSDATQRNSPGQWPNQSLRPEARHRQPRDFGARQHRAPSQPRCLRRPQDFPERLPPSPLMSPDLPVMSLDQLIQIGARQSTPHPLGPGGPRRR